MAAYYAGGTRLVGVEPETAPTLTMALDAGRPVEAPAGGVAADSLAPKQIGALAFEQAQRHVAATVLVTDDAIVARSEEHTSELQSLMRNSYAVFCLKKKRTSE